MLTKRQFDGMLIMLLLFRPAYGIVRMAARRWQREGDGALNTAGHVVEVLG